MLHSSTSELYPEWLPYAHEVLRLRLQRSRPMGLSLTVLYKGTANNFVRQFLRTTASSVISSEISPCASASNICFRSLLLRVSIVSGHIVLVDVCRTQLDITVIESIWSIILQWIAGAILPILCTFVIVVVVWFSRSINNRNRPN